MEHESSPLLEAIFNALGGASGPLNGIAYGLSSGNNVDELLATPNLWGRDPAVNDYVPTATNLRTAIENLVVTAEHTVDISTLSVLPDGLFVKALSNGIARAARNGKPIVVRVLEGVPFGINPVPGMEQFIKDLAAPEHVAVYVAAMQSGVISWNHSKLLIVDGKSAICGGHNQWMSTYCEFAPVHDVSLRLSGPAVNVAQNFLNALWTQVALYSRTMDPLRRYWSRMQFNGRLTHNALPRIDMPTAAAVGTTTMLALGRMGTGIVPFSHASNASRTARVEAVRHARSHVRISQQMLGSFPLMPLDKDFVTAICTHVARDRDLSIIISDTGATDQNEITYFGYGVSETARLIAEEVGRISGLRGDDLVRRLTQRVHIGPLRFFDKQPDDPRGQRWKWRNGRKVIEPANHTKVYVIDEHAFYVGSDNAYQAGDEAGLQEFGYLIAGEAQTRAFLDGYWNKAWSYSAQFKFTEWPRLVEANAGVLV